MSLDRQRLKSIRHLKLDKFFHYVEKLDCELPFNLPFTLGNYGELTFPISSKKFKLVRETYKLNTSVRQPCVLDSDCLGKSSVDVCFGSKVVSDFMLEYTEKTFQTKLHHAGIKAVFDCLVLCEDGETFTVRFNTERKPGSFGCLLMTLPLENNSSEIVATINYKTEVISHHLQAPSILTVAGPSHQQGRQDLVVKAAPQACAAFFMFSLIWTDAFQLNSFMKPDGFPAFIMAVREAEQALEAWKQVCLNQQQSAIPATPSTANNMQVSSNPGEKSSLSDVDANTTKFLCIPLLNSYCAYDLQLEKLKGIDMFMSQVLKSLDFIEVHLAVLSCPRRGFQSIAGYDSGSAKMKVSSSFIRTLPITWLSSQHWSDGTKIKVHLDSQLIWSITSKLENSTTSATSKPKNLCNMEVNPQDGGGNESDSSSVIVDYSFKQSAAEKKPARAVNSPSAGFENSDQDDEYDEYSEDSRSDQDDEYDEYFEDSCSDQDDEYDEYGDDDCRCCRHSGYDDDDHCSCCPLHEHDVLQDTEHAVLLIKPKWSGINSATTNSKDAIAELRSRLADVQSKMTNGTLSESDTFFRDLSQLISHICSSKVDKCAYSLHLLDLLEIATRLHRIDDGVKILEFIAGQRRVCKTHDFLVIPFITNFILIAGWSSCSEAILRMVDHQNLHAKFPILGIHLFYSRCLDGAVQLAEKIMGKLPTHGIANPDLNFISSIAELGCLLQTDAITESQARYGSLLCYLKKYNVETFRRAFEKAQQNTTTKGIFSQLMSDMSDFYANARLSSIRVSSFASIVKQYGGCSGETKLVDSLMAQIFAEVENDRKAAAHERRPWETFLHRLIICLKKDEDRIEILKQMTRYPSASKALDAAVESLVIGGADYDPEQMQHLESYLDFFSLAENEKELSSPNRVKLFEDFLFVLGPAYLIEIADALRERTLADYKQNAGRRKFYSLLLEQAVSAPMVLLVECPRTFKRLFQCLLWAGNDGITTSLVQRMVDESAGAFDVIRQLRDCLSSLFNKSDCYPGFGNNVELYGNIRRVHITTLLKVWINCATHEFEVFSAIILNEHFVSIFTAYYTAEKTESDKDDKEVPTLLLQMAQKVQTASLKFVIVRIYSLNTKDLALTNLSPCFNVFKSLCNLLVARPDFSQTCLDAERDRFGESLKNMTECLLWIGDEKPIAELFKTLNSIVCGASALHGAKVRIMTDQKICVLAKRSSHAFKAFSNLINGSISKMRDAQKPRITWAFRNASVPREPRVQQFMRSEREREVFTYKTAKGAEAFGKRITSLNPSWGLKFSLLKATVRGEYGCEITKTRKYQGAAEYIHGITNELPRLERIQKEFVAREESAEPANKRVKLES